jgi:hypothetical protein
MPAAATSNGGVRVSEGPATGVDPRFDPRFQRGYVPEAAAAPQATDVPAAPVDVAPVRDGDAAPAEAVRALVRDDAAAEPDDVPASVDPFAEDALAEEERLSPTRWMWIALGACVAFVIVGAVAFWVQASDPSNYIGGVRAGIDETFRLVINALAPALVQAGLIGIIVVLVTWAVRGRMARAPEDRP